MRIAIFTELYAPSVGGQEQFFAGLSLELVKRGHVVDVYCIAHVEGLAVKECLQGVTVHRYPEAPKYKKPLYAPMKRNWSAIWKYARHIRSVCKKRDYDFYLLNQWPFLHAVFLPGGARKRAMLHWCEIRQSTFYRFVQNVLPRLVKDNAAISDLVAQHIHKRSGREVLVLPSGLDLAKSRRSDRSARQNIVVLGRVAAHKNLPFLIDAFELLKDEGYLGRLLIAGDGPAMPELRERINMSQARKNIDLLGYISDDVKFSLLSTCEVLAMPSKREGFPHVVAEAMLCGLPIVTAEYPENGTASVVQACDSGVVTAPDARSFADGIRDALVHWHTYSENGHRASMKLSWSKIAENLEVRIEVASNAQIA